MFAIFITSLLLLAALLVLKMLELQAGRRFFLTTWRNRIDEMILDGWRSVQSSHTSFIGRARMTSRRLIGSWRYRLSGFLEKLAEKLRE